MWAHLPGTLAPAWPELSAKMGGCCCAHKVIRTFHTLAAREKWGKGLPRYALGGSSGGAFLLNLALRLEFTALCAQIMAVRPGNLQASPHVPGASSEPACRMVGCVTDRLQEQDNGCSAGIAFEQLVLLCAHRWPALAASSHMGHERRIPKLKQVVLCQSPPLCCYCFQPSN